MSAAFIGAKLALFVGRDLAVILRDDVPEIPWPGHWDMPGGGREGNESPLDCALRETREELGLTVAPEAVSWGRCFSIGDAVRWFFVGHVPQAVAAQISLGNEGQRWALMAPEAYMSHPLAIPHFADSLQLFLTEAGSSEKPPARGGGS